MKKTLAHFFIFLFVFACAKYFEIKYSYEDVKDYISLLSGISGIVFTIMGIWIAFLYPNALSRLANPGKIETADFSGTLDDTKRLEQIVAAILKSSIVAMVLALFVLIKIFFFHSDLYLKNFNLVKSFALALITVCTSIQMDAVISVIVANVLFLNDLHKKRQEKRANELF